MYNNELVAYRPYPYESTEESIEKMIRLAEGNEFTSKSDYWMKIKGVTMIVSQGANFEREIKKLHLQLRMERHCALEAFEFSPNKERYRGLCSSNLRMDLACRVGRFIQASAKRSDIDIQELLRQTFISLATLYSKEELYCIEKTLWTYWIHRDLFSKFSVDSLFRDNGRRKKKKARIA